MVRLAALLTLSTAPLAAQSGGDVADRFRSLPRSEKTTISTDQVRKDVAYLASDELEGRRAGTRGNQLAATYIADRFRRLGLSTVPGGDEYYHSFGYVAGVRVGSGNVLMLHGPGFDRRPTVGVDFNPMGFSGVASASAPLLFVGYGITASDMNYDDYAGIDAKGKIVVMMRYSPDGSGPHSGFGRHMAFSAKVRNAKDHGAVGIIFINQPSDESKLYPVALDRNFTDAEIASVFARNDLFSAVRDPSGRTLSQVQAAIDSTRTPVSFAIAESSAEVRTDVSVERVSIPNVVASLPGNDPELRDQIIVVGAHFDHLGWGGEGSLYDKHDSAIHHGADDNASGTAGVMALAEYFARAKNNRRTLVFMAFNAEEEGLLGSQSFVSNLPFPDSSIVTMVNMDMIGRLDSNTLVVQGTGSSPTWEPMLKELNGDRFALKLVKDGFGPSDHSSFYSRDIPVLFFFTNLHGDYHRPSDTWDKINYEGEAAVLDYVSDIVRWLDGRDDRPVFTKVPVSASARSGGVFKVYVGTIPDYAYEGKGLRLNGVAEGGPAEKGGLKAGDIIVKMDGSAIDNIYDYTDALARFNPKQQVETEYIRDGVTAKVVITMGSR